MALRAEKLKAFILFKNIVYQIAVCFLLLASKVEACLEFEDAFGDVYTGSSSFSDYDSLVANFKTGMVVETIEVC